MWGSNVKILEILVDKLLDYQFENEDQTHKIEKDFNLQFLSNSNEYQECLKYITSEEAQNENYKQGFVKTNLMPPNFPFDNVKVLYEEIKAELNSSTVFNSEMDIEKYFKGKLILTTRLEKEERAELVKVFSKQNIKRWNEQFLTLFKTYKNEENVKQQINKIIEEETKNTNSRINQGNFAFVFC